MSPSSTLSVLVTAAGATLSRHSPCSSMGNWSPDAGGAARGAALAAMRPRVLAARWSWASSAKGNWAARTCGGRNWRLICEGERRLLRSLSCQTACGTPPWGQARDGAGHRAQSKARTTDRTGATADFRTEIPCMVSICRPPRISLRS